LNDLGDTILIQNFDPVSWQSHLWYTLDVTWSCEGVDYWGSSEIWTGNWWSFCVPGVGVCFYKW